MTSYWRSLVMGLACRAKGPFVGNGHRGHMGEAAVWIAVMVAGVAVLGISEYIRANGVAASQWENIQTALLAGVLILAGMTALFLTVAYVLFVFIPEVKEILFYFAAAFAGIFLLLYATRRGGPRV